MLNVIFTRMENQALEAEVEAEIQSQNLNDSRNSNELKLTGDNKSMKSLKLDTVDVEPKREEDEINRKEIVVEILNSVIDNAMSMVTDNKQTEIINQNHTENETHSITSSLTR